SFWILGWTGTLLFALHLGANGLARWAAAGTVILIPLGVVHLGLIAGHLTRFRTAILSALFIFAVVASQPPFFVLIQFWGDKFKSGLHAIRHFTRGEEKEWLIHSLPPGTSLCSIGDHEFYYLSGFKLFSPVEEATQNKKLVRLA